MKIYCKDSIVDDLKTLFQKNNFNCLKKRVLRNRRDVSNNVILRTPTIPPPPPPTYNNNTTTNTIDVDLRPLLGNRFNIPPPPPP